MKEIGRFVHTLQGSSVAAPLSLEDLKGCLGSRQMIDKDGISSVEVSQKIDDSKVHSHWGQGVVS